MKNVIPRKLLPQISEAIRQAVTEFGHPDDIPLDAMRGGEVPDEVMELCFVLLTDEDFPSDPAAATAKWLRLIGQYSA